MKTYNRKILGLTLQITKAPNMHRWAVSIDGSDVKAQITKLENYKNDQYWRLKTYLPDAFENQFHKSLNHALYVFAKLYLRKADELSNK